MDYVQGLNWQICPNGTICDVSWFCTTKEVNITEQMSYQQGWIELFSHLYMTFSHTKCGRNIVTMKEHNCSIMAKYSIYCIVSLVYAALLSAKINFSDCVKSMGMCIIIGCLNLFHVGSSLKHLRIENATLQYDALFVLI